MILQEVLRSLYRWQTKDNTTPTDTTYKIHRPKLSGDPYWSSIEDRQQRLQVLDGLLNPPIAFPSLQQWKGNV